MKLKTKWRSRDQYVAGALRAIYEYLETPFGRISITLSSNTDRYMEPYDLSIPGCENRFFSTPGAAKIFAEDYLIREITKLVDMTASAQLPTQSCTSNT